jgi:hypothetical protein
LIKNIDNFLMGKFFLGKRRFYMALFGAVDDLGDGVVRNFGNVAMTVNAFNLAVNAFIENGFINIIVPSLAIFIDSADTSMSVAHETVVFIGRFCRGTGK